MVLRDRKSFKLGSFKRIEEDHERGEELLNVNQYYTKDNKIKVNDLQSMILNAKC